MKNSTLGDRWMVVDEEELERLIIKWDRLRNSYMDAGIDIKKKAEMSRIAAAYERCADDLRVALGRKPRWV